MGGKLAPQCVRVNQAGLRTPALDASEVDFTTCHLEIQEFNVLESNAEHAIDEVVTTEGCEAQSFNAVVLLELLQVGQNQFRRPFPEKTVHRSPNGRAGVPMTVHDW